MIMVLPHMEISKLDERKLPSNGLSPGRSRTFSALLLRQLDLDRCDTLPRQLSQNQGAAVTSRPGGTLDKSVAITSSMADRLIYPQICGRCPRLKQ